MIGEKQKNLTSKYLTTPVIHFVNIFRGPKSQIDGQALNWFLLLLFGCEEI